jgi:uncharacterized protein with PIN domain
VKFILTRELGRLAKWLRILGFDAAYFHQDKISSLIIQSLREERIILTRNQRLPKTRGLSIVFLQSEELEKQLPEVLKALQIKPDPAIMFTRCTLCNAGLKPIAKEEVRDKIPEYVYQTQNSFLTCPGCQRIYWQGTHWGNVTAMIKELRLR